jgi:hypothetical protein
MAAEAGRRDGRFDGVEPETDMRLPVALLVADGHECPVGRDPRRDERLALRRRIHVVGELIGLEIVESSERRL